MIEQHSLKIRKGTTPSAEQREIYHTLEITNADHHAGQNLAQANSGMVTEGTRNALSIRTPLREVRKLG